MMRWCGAAMGAMAMVLALAACDLSGDQTPKPKGPYVPRHYEIVVTLDNGHKMPCLLFGEGYPSVTCDWGHQS